MVKINVYAEEEPLLPVTGSFKEDLSDHFKWQDIQYARIEAELETNPDYSSLKDHKFKFRIILKKFNEFKKNHSITELNSYYVHKFISQCGLIKHSPLAVRLLRSLEIINYVNPAPASSSLSNTKVRCVKKYIKLKQEKTIISINDFIDKWNKDQKNEPITRSQFAHTVRALKDKGDIPEDALTNPRRASPSGRFTKRKKLRKK